MRISPTTTSYILAATSVPVVLHFHLLPAVFSGLAVHVLTLKLSRRLPSNWSGIAKQVSLAIIVSSIIASLLIVCFGFLSFLQSGNGIGALLSSIATTIENLKPNLPIDITRHLPASVEGIREELTALLREHSQKLSAIGLSSIKSFALAIFGMIIGGMTALCHIKEPEKLPPFASSLHIRLTNLARSFDRVVIAQVKISAINTSLTAAYLLVALPLFDVNLPMTSLLVLITFITGLIPVIGNLISNTIIVIISLGTSPKVAIASLAFLVLIHKAEYFIDAKLIGGVVQAKAWELMCAMIVMDAIFGMPGLISAPVIYAWLKNELRAKEVV